MRQPRGGGAQHHLERPAEAPVAEAEVEQLGAAGRPASDRGRSARRRCGAAPRARGRGSRPGGATARRPASARRAPSTRSRRPSMTRLRRRVAGRAVERAVAVHERDDVGVGAATARRSTRRRSRAAVRRRRGHRAVRRDLRGAVGRAVVDDDRRPARRDRREDAGDRGGFVEHREDHVGHRAPRGWCALRRPRVLVDDGRIRASAPYTSVDRSLVERTHR